MPTVDLNAILQPVVDTVRDLYFPSTATIQSRTDSRDSTGQPAPTWATLEADVAVLVEPDTQDEIGGGAIVNEDMASILMSDAHVIPQNGRILLTAGQGAGEAWDVAGYEYDPVRVTTSVKARRVTPAAV